MAMAESEVAHLEEEPGMASPLRQPSAEPKSGHGLEALPRKAKRKEKKKMKRKQCRQQAAEKERIEEETRLQDPVEQLKLRLEQQEEAEALEKERLEHDMQEQLWLERERVAQEDAERRRQDELQKEKEHEVDDDSWDYVEEGPAEIIWEGNEIIVRKQKVRVPKTDRTKEKTEENTGPISNPLPPQSIAFEQHQRMPTSTNHSVLDVMEETPNFGTEQDKTHCPFHIKTGVCRFGVRCSRAHVYPDKSCTLLMKNMYNGPGLACELDEGLEYTDEEVEQHYEEFYEDVHEEFAKYGELVNFKVCRNGSSHLRGNVYVHYCSMDSAMAAYNAINGRFYAGKQITCEFVGVTRWKVALCGEYMRSHHKVCSHGTACNFLHCFRNPRGDYEWANWDNPPPRSVTRDRRITSKRRDERSRTNGDCHGQTHTHHGGSSQSTDQHGYSRHSHVHHRHSDVHDSRYHDRKHEHRKNRHHSSRHHRSREKHVSRKRRHRSSDSERSVSKWKSKKRREDYEGGGKSRYMSNNSSHSLSSLSYSEISYTTEEETSHSAARSKGGRIKSDSGSRERMRRTSDEEAPRKGKTRRHRRDRKTRQRSIERHTQRDKKSYHSLSSFEEDVSDDQARESDTKRKKKQRHHSSSNFVSHTEVRDIGAFSTTYLSSTLSIVCKLLKNWVAKIIQYGHT